MAISCMRGKKPLLKEASFLAFPPCSFRVLLHPCLLTPPSQRLQWLSGDRSAASPVPPHGETHRPFVSPVARCRSPSLETFRTSWYTEQTPVVIEGAMELWEAKTWTIDTLMKKFGRETVPVELSRWNKAENRWADYRDLYRERTIGNRDELFVPNQPLTLENFIEIFMSSPQRKESPPLVQGYIAQQQLLDQLPSMAEGISDPVYANAGTGVYQRNVWLGPAGTITPLHRDPYHNILAQIWGSKYIRLYSPQESSKLYPFKTNLYLRSTSQVNVDVPDAAEKWPEFQKAPYFECELHAGEMIYIPIKWWHYVRANKPSFSISFWWL